MPTINQNTLATPVYIVDGVNGAITDNGNGTDVQGNVASGATDTGFPVKIGGKFNTTNPTFTNGQRGDAQLTNRGEIMVAPSFAGVELSTAANGMKTYDVATSNFVTNQVAVGTTATLIAAARVGRQRIVLSPTSSTAFYIGNSAVTAANGLYITAGSTYTMFTQAAVYAVGAAALTVSYIENY